MRVAELSALSGYGACLLLVALSAGAVADSVRLLAAIELKNAIGSLFATANQSAASPASVHTALTHPRQNTIPRYCDRMC